MEENNVNGQGTTETVGTSGTVAQAGGMPAKVSVWTKVKQFLCQEITVELTPKQEKVFQEVHDFWHQEVTWQGFKEFWLQDIEITL